MNRISISGFLVAAVLALLPVPRQVLAESHSGFPVDIIAGPAPQPFMADGREHLLYELHLTNYAPLPIELTGIDVFGDGTNALASYHGQVLNKMLIPVEKLSSADEPPSDGNAPAIGEGHSVVIFFDLTLDSGARVPAQLNHRFSFSVTPKSGKIERTVNAPVVTVVQERTPVLVAPLRGSSWAAFNALGSVDHRRSLNAVDGRERIPQRLAIDWMRLGPDGRLFHGDSKSNANFYDYGAEVLAVADGRVSDVKDGLPEYIGSSERSTRNITIDNAAGNYVILDLGHGRFALYAHLQTGSLRVKVGDTVRAGQVLALLGNSGNSDAPHLHFQLMDANSPLGSEGIPYELDTFTQLGSVPEDPALQENGEVLLPKSAEKAAVHQHEFPVNNAVVTFP
jgi:murein DD-endopeptidase